MEIYVSWKGGGTALQAAALYGHTKVVEILLNLTAASNGGAHNEVCSSATMIKY